MAVAPGPALLVGVALASVPVCTASQRFSVARLGLFFYLHSPMLDFLALQEIL